MTSETKPNTVALDLLADTREFQHVDCDTRKVPWATRIRGQSIWGKPYGERERMIFMLQDLLKISILLIPV